MITLLMCLFFLLTCTENVDSGTSVEKPDSTGTDSPPEVQYYEKAKTVYDLIRRYYYVDEYGLFKENYPSSAGDREVSYLWPYFGLLGGVNTLVEIGYREQSVLNVAGHLSKYYDGSHEPPSYAAYPPSLGDSDHFYDDNAVVGLELINAYKATDNPSYLAKAEEIMPFIYTGETDRCGGGIAWMENYIINPDDPNAIIGMSSSGYSTLLALKLYQETGKEEYLTFGKRVHQWLKEHLKDTSRNIYWNDIRMSDCSVNKNLWTYNTGVMMQIEVALYEITGEESYLNEARALARGAFSSFTHTANNKVFYPNHDPWFNVKLFQGYLDLYRHDSDARKYIDIFIENADYAWENARNEYDLFYEDWAGDIKGRDQWLLNQASLLEIYGRISLLLGEEME